MYEIGGHKFCCQLRAKFLVAIVAENPAVPDPVDLCDIVMDWGSKKKGAEKPILIGMPFCPFCGTKIDQSEARRDPR